MRDMGWWSEMLDAICALIVTFILLIGGIEVFDWLLNNKIAPKFRGKTDGNGNTSEQP